MESTFSTSRFWPLKLSRTATLVQGRDNPPGQGGVMAYLRQELPLGANTIPLAAFSFMSGYLNAVAFTTCAIWCGFMTGNSVMLGLALARVSLGHRREAAFAINDAQATTALITFVFGIALARVGDLSIWSGPKPINPSSPVNQDLEKASQEPELGARPSASINDLADSGAPTRVGTPVAFSQIPRLIVPSAPTPGPSSPLDNSPTNTLPPAKLDPKPETPVAAALHEPDCGSSPEPCSKRFFS
ncbi:transmembrane protein, putative [Rhizoctonia solani AG-3 Rhs1AP]|uniref:Transmembrane protein, putative n=1 Tax=Rhizoctonia solani AG-3 Rhs1AP TaxID=1086054 RepID=X8JD00_9AGAM|nr:transmembrane protein, putative [Rhizoctonia solani AG-3 Rhs1AP]